ncbi:MAG: hypothetical protein M3Z23_19245 [Acidobacteriota bacterium]|nr:hypothetical protein [Acidobacteriota bacterium]
MARFLFKLALFLLLGLTVTETAFRAALGWRTAWYGAAAATVKAALVDYIFAGSSRVAASIDEDRFAQYMGERLGRKVHAINMGMGFGSLADHYFGLRQLFESNPRNLRNVTVFVEAPLGLPMPDTWHDRWTIPGGSPDLFAPYVNSGDLARFWKSSDNDVFEKIYLTAAKYLFAVRKGGAVRNRIKVTGDRVVQTMLVKAGFAAQETIQADLTPAGGIRIDESDMIFVRKAARSNFASEMRDQRPIRHWDQSVLRSIVELVAANGGQVVLFDLPLNSYQWKPLSTGVRKTDRAVFGQVAGKWGVPILKTDFPTEDSDYPDAWHLRRSLAGPFTTALAKSYAGYLETKPVERAAAN